jgi:thioredoxin-related protein
MKVFLFKVLALGLMLSTPQYTHAQLSDYQFEQIERLQNQQKRNVVIFIHSQWCKYCYAMKNTTFRNNQVIDVLNNHFYFIYLDAEERRSINYRGQTFEYKATGVSTGVHELAQQLGTINKKINYPAIVVLNSSDEIIFQHNEFLNAHDLLKILEQLYSKTSNE